MSELNEFDFDKVMLCIEKRGIFGCLYHLMAQIVLDKNYLMEPVESQNNLIFEHLKLDSPIQVEKISKAIYDNKIKAKYVLDQIFVLLWYNIYAVNHKHFSQYIKFTPNL